MTNTKTREYQRLVEQETLIVDAGELICELLETQGIERKELARRLGKTKGFVTQVLSGKNLTLKTLADLAFALDHRFELHYAPLSAARNYDRAVGMAEVADSDPQPYSGLLDTCSGNRRERRPGQMRAPISEPASLLASEADADHSFSLAA